MNREHKKFYVIALIRAWTASSLNSVPVMAATHEDALRDRVTSLAGSARHGANGAQFVVVDADTGVARLLRVTVPPPRPPIEIEPCLP